MKVVRSCREGILCCGMVHGGQSRENEDQTHPSPLPAAALSHQPWRGTELPGVCGQREMGTTRGGILFGTT